MTVTLIQRLIAPNDAPQNVDLVRWTKTDSEGRYHFRVGSGRFDIRDPEHQQPVQLKIESQPEVIQDFGAN